MTSSMIGPSMVSWTTSNWSLLLVQDTPSPQKRIFQDVDLRWLWRKTLNLLQIVDADSNLDQDNWQVGAYPFIFPEGISKGNGPRKKQFLQKDLQNQTMGRISSHRHNSLSVWASIRWNPGHLPTSRTAHPCTSWWMPQLARKLMLRFLKSEEAKSSSMEIAHVDV